jgi:hypothetical protein
VQPLPLQLRDQLAAIGRDHAAFAGGDVLGRVEAEHTGIAEGAGGTPLVGRPEGMRRILDQMESGRTRHGAELAHLAGPPREMDGDHGRGSRRDRGAHRRRIERQPTGQDIREHRHRTRVQDGVGCARKGDRRGDHLVSRSDPERAQHEMKAGGTGAHGDGVGGADGRREGLLEARGARTRPEPPRTQHLEDRALLLDAEGRPRERQESAAHRSSALDRRQWVRCTHLSSRRIGMMRVREGYLSMPGIAST